MIGFIPIEAGRAGKGEVEVLLVHDAAAAAAVPPPPAQGYPVYPYPVPPGMIPVYAVPAPGAPGGVVYQALQMAPGVRPLAQAPAQEDPGFTPPLCGMWNGSIQGHVVLKAALKHHCP